jgi:hypothetical protein
MVMELIEKFFDVYTIKARLIPALFVILPILLIAIALFPDNIASSAKIIGLSVSCVVLLVIAVNFTRERGRAIENKLYEKWGGKPTTYLLRHSSSQNELQLVSWHEKITKITGKIVPNKDEEKANPEESDKIYDSYIKILLNKTRDVPLVFQENCNYGFRRNLLGMRTFGLITSSLGIFLNTAFILNIIGLVNIGKKCQEHNSMQELLEPFLPQIIDSSNCQKDDWIQILLTYLKHADITIISLGLFGSILLSIFWLLCVNSNWVKLAADTFANRLLEASENLT